MSIDTEQKTTSQTLKDDNDLDQNLINNISKAVFVIDPAGKIQLLNHIASKISKYDPEELIGQPFSILLTEDSLSNINERILEITSAEIHENIPEYHAKMVCKDKEHILVNIGLAILLKDKKYNGMVWTIEDITERRRIYEIIDRKQKNLEAIFDASSLGMMLIDQNMVVRRVNRSIKQMVQKDFVEIINRPIGEIMGCIGHSAIKQDNPETADQKEDVFHKYIKIVFESDKGIENIELQTTLKLGDNTTDLWLAVSVEPVVIDKDRYVVVSINDITNRKEAEKRLKETMEMKSQFISTVSHELRTPLAALKEAILIVLDGVAGRINKKQRYFLDMSKRNIERLSRLINDVLDFQKLQAGSIELNLQENDVSEIIDDVYHTMLVAAKKKTIEFTIEIADILPKVKFDSDKMIQVLTNLINNAIKFTPENGRVSVKAKCENDNVLITVTDNGMGMPKEECGKIFNKFYRVNRPGKQIQGTGLGLSIAYDIVKLHGGRIEVQSELDKGSVFKVFLPLKPASIAPKMTQNEDELLEETLICNSHYLT